MKLILATKNPGKLRELRSMLSGSGWDIQDLAQAGVEVDVIEDGATYAENARKKALAVAEVSGFFTLADDSGLEIDALNGMPGVHSSSYLSPDATYEERCQAILREMRHLPEKLRSARFRCVMCLVDPKQNEHYFEGICEGTIAFQARGKGGFGYDPIFIPEHFSQTFAELPEQVKNSISHRAKALRQVILHLTKAYGQTGH